MRRLGLVLLLAGALLGCKSRPLGPYVCPRVTGQVLAADTHRPLPGVKVNRGLADTGTSMVSPPKGAEVLMRKPPVQTDGDGRFVIPSERVLSVIRGSGWNIVSLHFREIGFLPFETNCPLTAATNSAGGEPVLDMGQIFLTPVGQ